MKVINYEEIKEFFEKNCKHLDAYRDEGINFRWKKCRDCLLNTLYTEYQYALPDFSLNLDTTSRQMNRTMCFAIWHDDVLNDVIHNIQTTEPEFWSGWQTILIHKGIAYMPLDELRGILQHINHNLKIYEKDPQT